jgi:hypothetical protein
MSDTNTVSPLCQQMIEDMAARKLNPSLPNFPRLLALCWFLDAGQLSLRSLLLAGVQKPAQTRPSARVRGAPRANIWRQRDLCLALVRRGAAPALGQTVVH